MKLSTLIERTRKLAKGNPHNYPLSAYKALEEFGFRPRQQWGVTRGLTVDVEVKDFDNLTTLLSLVTKRLGQEGNAVKEASKPIGTQLNLVLI